MLWRGAGMKYEWIAPFVNNIGMNVNLPGNQSTSRSPQVALGFATKNLKPDFSPVLFVISCRNYTPPDGFSLNNEAYTSYPDEDEFLLTEGCQVYILKI